MQQATKMGMNRTGVQMSPLATPELLKAIDEFQPAVEGRDDGAAIAQLRVEYASEADRLGSIPPPGTLRGAMTTGVRKLTGKNPEVLIDKLGERLAFERSGTRLYEAFLVKLRAGAAGAERIPVDEVEQMCEAERKHFAMLAAVLQSIGADPTCQTPGADATGVMSMGLVQAMTDPRTSLPQALEALLTAELVDNASWELLIDLAQQGGLDEPLDRFRSALAEEEEHLTRVRGWLKRALSGEAG